MQTNLLMSIHGKRKRQRPWTSIAVWVASSLFLPTITATQGNALLEYPLLFDVQMTYSGTNVVQLAKDTDQVLEAYLLENLFDIVDVSDVLLGTSIGTNRRNLRILQEVEQSQRNIVVQVYGNIVYRFEEGGCSSCVREDIETELDHLLTKAALNYLIQTSGMDDVDEVTQVLQLSESTPMVDEPFTNRQATTPEGDNPVFEVRQDDDIKNTERSPPLDGRGNPLERPSTVAIIFGFLLTGIAAMGLVGYMYIFYRKRQKRLLKQRRERQSMQYRQPSAGVTPTGQPIVVAPQQLLMPPKPPPSIPTTATVQAYDDDRSTGSDLKLDTMSSDGGGAADAFARELQVAASLDEQAWEEFQKKKDALERSRDIEHIMSTSPIPPPPTATQRQSHSSTIADISNSSQEHIKSFPYGDENGEEGVELTNAIVNPENGMSFMSQRTPLQPEEAQFGGRHRRDPDPSMHASEETSNILQSIEQTLAQYKDESRDEEVQMDDASEVVDEVARLSRFVQLYEKRKNRRLQFESERLKEESITPEMQASPASRHVGFDGSISSRSPAQQGERSDQRRSVEQMNYGKQRLPNAPENSQRTHQALARQTAYRGITMTGQMYSDSTLANLNQPSISMSDSDDAYSHGPPRDEDSSSLRSGERLGITPFSVQKVLKPYENGEEKTTNSHSRFTVLKPDRKPPARLSNLRSGQAIVDSSQSDVNIGDFDENLGEVSPRTTRVPQGQSSHSIGKTVNQSRATPSTEAPLRKDNTRFSKIRNLFEERPKNAIFPPDENWQSGVNK